MTSSSGTQATPPARRSRNALREKLRRVHAPSQVKTFPTIPEPLEPLELPAPLLDLPYLTSSEPINLPCIFERRLLSVIFEQPQQEADEATYRPWSEHRHRVEYQGSPDASSNGSTSTVYSCTFADYSTTLTIGVIDRQPSAPLGVIEVQGELWEPLTQLQIGAGSAFSRRRYWKKRITASIKSVYRRAVRWSRSSSVSH